MNSLHRIFFSVSLCLVIMLGACAQPAGTYRNNSWDYDLKGNGTNQQAEGLNTAAATTPQVQRNTANLKPVKVAILLPLSGQSAPLGDAMLNAAQLALFDTGHSNFELLPYDTKGTQQGGQQAATAVINDGAELILGPVFATAARGAKPVAARSNINMIAFSTDWTLAGGNGYVMGFLPFDQVDRVLGYAASRNTNAIGLIAPSDQYGNAVTAAYNKSAQRYRLNTTISENFAPQSSDLSSVMRNFTRYDQRAQAGANAPVPYNAVFMPTGGQKATQIANLLSTYGLPPERVRRIGTGLMDDSSLARDQNLQGAWFAAPSPISRSNFERRYRETFGSTAPRLATLAYDATALSAILAQRGLQSSGQPAFDAGSIRNPNGFTGIDGIFRFRNDGTAERGLAVLEFKNGQIVEVDKAPTSFQKAAQF